MALSNHLSPKIAPLKWTYNKVDDLHIQLCTQVLSWLRLLEQNMVFLLEVTVRAVCAEGDARDRAVLGQAGGCGNWWGEEKKLRRVPFFFALGRHHSYI